MSARGRQSADPLSRKVPENPKYKHVRPTVDTGASITRYMAKLEEMKRDYKFRKDEIFKRMKITTFVQLIIQVADFDSQTEFNGAGESTDRPDTADLEVRQIQENSDDDMSDGGVSQRETDRSLLEQVIRGVGEVDLNSKKNQNHDSQPIISTSHCPYLLLDIRDPDAYNECHIISAKSYPIAMLSRSVNYETKDMLGFKNQEGKIIVIYDDDEKISHRAATTLVQRGYDNLFMLSGGLKVAYKLFPEGLVTGTVPASLMEGSLPGSKPKVPPQIPVIQVPADKTDFTQEDLDKLVMYIDSALSDNSTASRLSKRPPREAGRLSSASTVASSTISSMSGRPAFRP